MEITNGNQVQQLLSLEKKADSSAVADEKEYKKLKEAAQNFEAIFINQLLSNMRKTIPESNLFGSGLSSEIYSGMFDEKMAQTIASKGGLHLSDIIIESLDKNPGKQKGVAGLNLAKYRLRPIQQLVKRFNAKDWDRSLIQQAARRYKVDPKLVEAVIKIESNFKANAISKKGAVGLMQLMKSTAESLGIKNRFNPQQNIYGGTKYLKQMLNKFDGDLELALSAYNAGPAVVEKYQTIPPFEETQTYVKKVLQTYRAL